MEHDSLKETITDAVIAANQPLSLKQDIIIQKMGELEKSIISLENHRNGLSEKLTNIQTLVSRNDERLNVVEKQILTIQVQGTGVSKISTWAGSIMGSVITGLIVGLVLYFVKK